MRKLLPSLALIIGIALPLHATQYTFGDFAVTLSDSASHPLTGLFELQLGRFAGAFLPSPANLTDWPANWINASSGYYDGSIPGSPEWSASMALADNSVFAVNDQLFLWAFDTQAGIGSQWALFTDTSWRIVSNDGLDPTTYFLEFTAGTSVVYGSLDLAGGSAGASLVSPTAVPESGAGMTLVFALGVSLLAAIRKRVAGAAAYTAVP